MNSSASGMLYLAGEFELAREQALKTIEIDDNFTPPCLWLGWACQECGRPKEAAAALKTALASSGDSPLSRASLGRTLAMSGRRAEARRIADELEELRRKRYVPAYYLAFLYAGLEEKDRALSWLEKACEERSAWAAMMKVDPKFAGILEEPRFQELLRRIGLAE